MWTAKCKRNKILLYRYIYHEQRCRLFYDVQITKYVSFDLPTERKDLMISFFFSFFTMNNIRTSFIHILGWVQYFSNDCKCVRLLCVLVLYQIRFGYFFISIQSMMENFWTTFSVSWICLYTCILYMERESDVKHLDIISSVVHMNGLE